MGKPKELFWVEMKLSGTINPWHLSAGVRGGKRSSLQACKDAKAQILKADPGARVKIFRSAVVWEEVE